MNAIPAAPETAPARTERLLRTCRELTELGMDVARAAAREAVANLNTPIEHPMPGAALPPVCRTEDPGLLFTKIARAVRQSVLLETRIAAGDTSSLIAPPPTPCQAAAGQAPRRKAKSAERLHIETLEPLDKEFCFPGNDRPIPEILGAIRETLGVAPDFGTNLPAFRPAHPKTGRPNQTPRPPGNPNRARPRPG